MGSWTANDQPGNLYTGMWSPFFGQGYTGFYWSPSPTNLNDVIGEPVLKQSSGPLFGAKIGFNISPQFQLGLSFGCALTKFSFTDDAWNTIGDTFSESEATLLSIGRTVQSTDNSVPSEGSMILLLATGSYAFMPEGQFIPYVSFGAGVALHSGAPSIVYNLTQTWVGTSSSYGLNVAYATKTSFAFNLGLGVKICLGEGMGFKLEASGIFSPVSLDEQLTTSFSRTHASWIAYTPYDETASVQKSGRIIIGILGGFFFGF